MNEMDEKTIAQYIEANGLNVYTILSEMGFFGISLWSGNDVQESIEEMRPELEEKYIIDDDAVEGLMEACYLSAELEDSLSLRTDEDWRELDDTIRYAASLVCRRRE